MAIGTLLQLLAVTTLSVAAPWKRSPLEVQLVHLNDTAITAVVTNTGRKAYHLLHRNSILDPHPSRKLHVSSHATIDAPFRGIHTHCSTAPSSLDFTSIAAGETLYRTVDVAELYELSAGIYEIAAQGSLPYANDGSLSLAGDSASFSSNVLELPVTTDKAEKLVHAQLVRRTTFESDCSSEQLASVTAATEDCASMAKAAANAATSGDAAFLEKYFMDSFESTRSKVAEVFQAVAKECQNTPGGSSTSHCTDQMNHCSGNVLAYTYWQGYGTEQAGEVYYCPSYYNLPSDGSYCHGQTQGGNVLHEMTHAVAGTDDLGYGYDAISMLSTEQALMNADTYTLYAQDLQLGCNGGSGSGTVSGDSEDPVPSEGSSPGEPTVSAWPSTPSESGSWTTWTSPDGTTWQVVPAEDSSSSSQTTGNSQSWSDWWTAFMSSYRSSYGSSGAPVSRITSADREFGDGVDHRGHDHTQGSDEHGHWTD